METMSMTSYTSSKFSDTSSVYSLSNSVSSFSQMSSAKDSFRRNMAYGNGNPEQLQKEFDKY